MQCNGYQATGQYPKRLLLRGPDLNDKKPPKAAWKMICMPKEE
jgi:hypothetical protein